MKILIVHQYYLMPGQFGGSRFNEMARMWTDGGHDVTVIAGTVEYGSGSSPEKYRGRWITEEIDGAVKVYRCYVPRTYGKSFRGRMWGFFGFTLSSATAALRVPRPDIVIATSPPLVAVIPGWVAAKLSFKPAPWIFEVRDLWPESAVTTGVLTKNSLLTRILYALEKWACRSADRINVLTPAFQSNIEDRGLASSGKIVFVPNGADTESFFPEPRGNSVRRQFGWGDRFVATYAGAHGRANALRQLIGTAELLRDRPDILIACFGDGPERKELESEALTRGLDNIVFYGPQPKAMMPAIVNASDLGLAVLQNNPTFRTVYPNKVFDYMSCARPVLLAIDGVARRLVCEQAEAGVFAEPENPAAIASMLRTLADEPANCARMGESGRRWVLANAGRDALAARYLKIMEQMVGRGQPATVPVPMKNPYRRFFKAAIDRVVALTALIGLSPVMAVLAFTIRRRLGSPVLFRQTRIGLNERPFEFLKFRTMTDERDADGNLLPDHERLTPFGVFLRANSLDELPQFWNVLQGDMSLIGPRPLLPQYLPRYSAFQRRRHEVKPGITGWAQINGRNDVSWERRFELDVWYVNNWSLRVDFRILIRTLQKVFRREGISQGGHATMPEFRG